MKINGQMHYVLRAVDHEGDVLEPFATKKGIKKAALKVHEETHEAARLRQGDYDRRLTFYGAAL